jgi:hypothetical protein
MSCSLDLHADEIRTGDCLRCHAKESIPVQSALSSLRLGKDCTDYKTDYILAGRSWTTVDNASPKSANFEGDVDDLGRSWTARCVLQNRRLQVRFLSHLPR